MLTTSLYYESTITISPFCIIGKDTLLNKGKTTNISEKSLLLSLSNFFSLCFSQVLDATSKWFYVIYIGVKSIENNA